MTLADTIAEWGRPPCDEYYCALCNAWIQPTFDSYVRHIHGKKHRKHRHSALYILLALVSEPWLSWRLGIIGAVILPCKWKHTVIVITQKFIHVMGGCLSITSIPVEHGQAMHTQKFAVYAMMWWTTMCPGVFAESVLWNFGKRWLDGSNISLAWLIASSRSWSRPLSRFVLNAMTAGMDGNVLFAGVLCLRIHHALNEKKRYIANQQFHDIF